MKCQQCGVNRASINIAMQINNERQHLRVCNECFEKVQNQLSDAANFFQNGDMFSNPFVANNFAGQNNTRTRTKRASRDSLLDQLGTNVMDEARNGKIDQVIEDGKRTNLNS